MTFSSTTAEQLAPKPQEDGVFRHLPALNAVTRTARPTVLLLGYVAISLLMAPLNLSTWLREGPFLSAFRLSHGLVFPNLMVGLAGLALTLVLICWPARLSLSDIGWKRSGLRAGLIAVLAIWGTLQIAALLAALLAGVELSLHPAWRATDYSGIGRFVSQLFGTALFEETLFRGIFLVQVFSILSRQRPGHATRWIALAMLLSALAFAVPHVPNRIVNQSYSGITSVLVDQALLTLAGLVFAWIYLSSGNLWMLIGFHALVNAPTPILASPLDGNYEIILVFGVLILFLVPRLRRSVVSWVLPQAARRDG